MERLQILKSMKENLRAVGMLLVVLVMPVNAAEVVNVDDKVSVTFSGMVLNRTTNTYDTLATVSNTSQNTLEAPMSLVITSISQNTVILANPSGQTLNGKPFLDLAVPVGGFPPGGSISQVLLKFSNPNRVRFSFTRSVLGAIKTVTDPNAEDDDGDALSENQGDCNDANAAIHPGATELCNSLDDNCSGTADEGFDVGAVCTAGKGVCEQSGEKSCASDGRATICNAVPGTPTVEVCGNAADDNCDGQVDESTQTLSCGVGACVRTVDNCEGGSLQQCLPGNPRPEVCGNDVDEDCNGVDLTCPIPIAITSPQNLSAFSRSPVTVSGTVAAHATQVSCNDVSASLNSGAFSAAVPLREGNNTLTCVARDAEDKVGTASITATLDTTGPRVTIDSPGEGATLTASPVTVTGMINDIVVGTVNGEQARVTCNGKDAQVANRAFVAIDIPLVAGANTITCTGNDRAGNVDTEETHVTLDSSADKKIMLVSGNIQTGAIGELLPVPLVVALTKNGAPAVGEVVAFKVMENDGVLSNGPNTGRFLLVVTDSDGRAAAQYRLGTWAGAGNNRVEAKTVGFAGEVLFSASAQPAAPGLIVVDAGNNQTGVVGQELPRPFVATVVDAGSNRLAGVPVTFTVKQGGGMLDGQPSKTLVTDSDGRVQVVPTLGPEEGIDNNVVEATFLGNTGVPAVFVASAKSPGNPADTSLSGVVLDNSNVPISGVTLRVNGSPNLTVQSNAEGQFLIQPAPVGHIQLIADGSTAQRPGKWPNLEYDLVTIAGRSNTLGMPIYLLPVDLPGQRLFVDENTGGTLSLSEVPGFALTVAPGSAAFPDGSRSGFVSVTVVHADKVPMVPNFGQQPRFIVTIQPAGTHFNPPAALSIPNVDGLASGQKTEMYSFDHDLGQFVSIGPGTVSEDGTVIHSDPGVGVIKGGWHCGGNPARTGTCKPKPKPPECDDDDDCDVLSGACNAGKCVEGACEAVPTNEGGDCGDGDACNGAEICQDGACRAEGDPVDCSHLETLCSTGICDPDSGLCEVAAKNEGQCCDSEHRCVEGACQPDASCLIIQAPVVVSPLRP